MQCGRLKLENWLQFEIIDNEVIYASNFCDDGFDDAEGLKSTQNRLCQC